MPDHPQDPYADAFDARCATDEHPGVRRVEGPGIRGLVPVDGTSPAALLVLDDRALDMLSGLQPLAPSGTVRVYDTARRCAELLLGDGRWRPKTATAMVCRDLRRVPELPLPDGLTLRTVARRAEDPPGVPLPDAAAAAARATSADERSGAELAAYLEGLPDGTALFAAVDGDGVVRGTSGSRRFASDAYVFFVNTDPGWRRRGVGLSMTATALHHAAQAGACRASLDASGAGVPLYERLGFTALGRITQFTAVSGGS